MILISATARKPMVMMVLVVSLLLLRPYQAAGSDNLGKLFFIFLKFEVRINFNFHEF